MSPKSLTDILAESLHSESQEERRSRNRQTSQARDEYEKRHRQLLLLARRIRPLVQRLHATLAVVPQTAAPIAQVVEYVHRRLGQRGLIFCPSTAQARGLAHALVQTGLKAQPGNGVEIPDGRAGDVDVYVQDSGNGTIAENICFILHLGTPRDIATYVGDLESVPACGRLRPCVVLSSDVAVGGMEECDRYCQTRSCRYVQIVRLSDPSLVQPKPYEFSCRHCDVCLSKPRDFTEDSVYRAVMLSTHGTPAGDSFSTKERNTL